MLVQEFVSGLKEGDSWRRVRYGSGWHSIPYIETIEFARKTKTQVILLVSKSERRYRISDGRLIGKGYDVFPMPSTPDEIAAVESRVRASLCKQEIKVLVQKLENVIDEQALMRVKNAIESAIAQSSGE